MDWVRAETGAGRIALDPSIGNIRELQFQIGGRALTPLHTAPWADDPDLLHDDTILPIEARLAGDFFCAPFGAADLDGSPVHGWTANSEWRLLDRSDRMMRFGLVRKVMGATVIKTLTLAGDAPLLYQAHEIDGGNGQLPVAHHPMIRLAAGGTFSTSPKCAAITPDTPLEHGIHRLDLGQRVTDLSRLPTTGGGVLDLHNLPIADRHEDFVTLVEAPGGDLGWSAVIREAEDDIVFVLKDPAVLPVTMLWHSNGGRDYPPWNGRHRGVLGIEDGCAPGAAGHRAARESNPVSDEGVATALTLGQPIRIAHVLGSVPRPEGWTRVRAITAENGQLKLFDAAGASLSLSFDTDFLKKEP